MFHSRPEYERSKERMRCPGCRKYVARYEYYTTLRRCLRCLPEGSGFYRSPGPHFVTPAKEEEIRRRRAEGATLKDLQTDFKIGQRKLYEVLGE